MSVVPACEGCGYALELTPDGRCSACGFEYLDEVRPTGDAPGTHPASRQGDGGKGAGASLRPVVRRTQDGTHLPASPSSPVLGSTFAIEGLADFIAVEEETGEALLGAEDGPVLPAGGTALWYGRGGSTKTTTGVDRAFHLASGRDWLDIPVARPVRVLWIENEGPRGSFRKKLKRKAETWDGPPLEDRFHVFSRPWARFSFKDDAHLDALVERLDALGTELVFAGPVSRLGLEGGGTPAEVAAFLNRLELVRDRLGRPLAYDLTHHENKAGAVSGAWDGATDTIVHVQRRGNGHTALVWDKTRWADDLNGETWKLNWLRECHGYERDLTPETTDEDVEVRLLALVADNPGKSWNTYEDKLSGKAKRKRDARDRLLEEKKLVDQGGSGGMKLFRADDIPPDDEQTTIQEG